MGLCASGWVLLPSGLPHPAQTVPKAPGRCCGINPGAVSSCLGGQGSCCGTGWMGLQRPALVLRSGERPWGRAASPRDGTPFAGGGHGSGAQLSPPWHGDPKPACWLPRRSVLQPTPVANHPAGQRQPDPAGAGRGPAGCAGTGGHLVVAPGRVSEGRVLQSAWGLRGHPGPGVTPPAWKTEGAGAAGADWGLLVRAGGC